MKNIFVRRWMVVQIIKLNGKNMARVRLAFRYNPAIVLILEVYFWNILITYRLCSMFSRA